YRTTGISIRRRVRGLARLRPMLQGRRFSSRRHGQRSGYEPRPWTVLLQELLQLGPVDDFFLDETLGDRTKRRGARLEDGGHLLRGVVEDLPHLDVDFPCGLLAMFALARRRRGTGEERRAGRLVEVDAAQAAHAELFDHAAGDAAGALQVAAGAVG